MEQNEISFLFLLFCVLFVHLNPTKSSSSLTVVQCAHNVKILQDNSTSTPEGWSYVQVGDDRGFVENKYLKRSRPKCFQEKYPKFYLNLNLDLTDMYYWGKLVDQFVEKESKVQ